MIAPTLKRLAVKIDDLQPHPRNARRGDVSAILASLRRFGQVRPIVVQASTGYVVAGNHVLAAMREAGEPKVAAVRVELTDDDALAYLVADNRTAEVGGYDDPGLTAVLDELRSRGLLDGTGFDDAEVEARLEALRDLASPPPDDDAEPPIPEAPKVAGSREGEVYELGPHRLLCGDSTDRAQVALLTGDERAHAVVTDPPYAIYGSASGISSSVSDDGMVRPFFLDVLRLAQEVTVEFAQVYVCCDWRSWAGWWEMAKRTELEPKNLLVWDKGSSGLGNNWANTYELIGYFVHMPPERSMTSGRRTGMRPVLRPNVLRHDRVTGDERQHNAAKPVAMMRELITAGTDEGEVVLDPFGGSGSTMMAAEREGRVCWTIERDPLMCDVIRDRYAALVSG